MRTESTTSWLKAISAQPFAELSCQKSISCCHGRSCAALKRVPDEHRAHSPPGRAAHADDLELVGDPRFTKRLQCASGEGRLTAAALTGYRNLRLCRDGACRFQRSYRMWPTQSGVAGGGRHYRRSVDTSTTHERNACSSVLGIIPAATERRRMNDLLSRGCPPHPVSLARFAHKRNGPPPPGWRGRRVVAAAQLPPTGCASDAAAMTPTAARD